MTDLQNEKFLFVDNRQFRQHLCESVSADSGDDNRCNSRTIRNVFVEAAHKGLNEVLVLFLERNATLVDAQHQGGDFALTAAVRGGHSKAVGLLIERGADIKRADDADEKGLVLLACHSDFADIAAQLISAKANINMVDRDGITPLLIAVARRWCDCVEQLIAHGADVNFAFNLDRETPLMVAVNQVSPSLVKLLIEAGAEVNSCDIHGDTPLLMAMFDCESEEIVEQLLDAKADINRVNNAKETALMWAAINGLERIAAQLISHGADINKVDDVGHTALHYAIEDNYGSLVDLLLKHNADVNLGQCILELPVRLARKYIVAQLLDHGAAVSDTRIQQKTTRTIKRMLLEARNQKRRWFATWTGMFCCASTLAVAVLLVAHQTQCPKK